MAKQQPEKKPEPPSPTTRRVLPMQLQIGDRFTDEEGVWEITDHPFTTRQGKLVHAAIRKPGDAASSREKTWSESSELRLEGTALDFLDTRGGSVDLKFFLGRQPSKRARKRDLQWFRQEEARRLLLACRALKPPWFAFLLESFGGGLHAGKGELPGAMLHD